MAEDSDDKLSGRGGGGDSGGGAYPDPHRGKPGGKDRFMGGGGQTEKAYHGHGRLGDDAVADNPNATAAND
ncbi:MAG TPA: hypothetical protein VEA61_04545 [Allosphingosinicella sp.]|nr:hypothetical protein [Allosphingosinicella sp.]